MTSAQFFAGYSSEWFTEKAAQFIANEPQPLRVTVEPKQFHGPHKIRNRNCYWASLDIDPCGKCTACAGEFYD